MAIEWMPREHEMKSHDRYGKEHWGTEAPVHGVREKTCEGPEG